MRVKLSGNASVSQSPQFLFDSGGFNGQGVSFYLKNGELYGEVADKKRFWRVRLTISRVSATIINRRWCIRPHPPPLLNGDTSAIKTCYQPVLKGEEGGLDIELYFPSVGVISQQIWLGLQLSLRKK